MVKTPLSMPGAQIRSLVGGTRILHAMQHGQKIKTKIKSILGKMRTGFSATCLYCTGENCSRRRDYKCGGYSGFSSDRINLSPFTSVGEAELRAIE